MIVWHIKKLQFEPNKDIGEGTFIELCNIFGKLIYRIETKGRNLIMDKPNSNVGYHFQGNWDYLKIDRIKNGLIGSFKLELFCPNCSDKIYKLSGKLPFLISVKTDFHVTKDTN